MAYPWFSQLVNFQEAGCLKANLPVVFERSNGSGEVFEGVGEGASGLSVRADDAGDGVTERAPDAVCWDMPAGATCPQETSSAATTNTHTLRFRTVVERYSRPIGYAPS
jgi:hypothetical protein